MCVFILLFFFLAIQIYPAHPSLGAKLFPSTKQLMDVRVSFGKVQCTQPVDPKWRGWAALVGTGCSSRTASLDRAAIAWIAREWTREASRTPVDLGGVPNKMNEDRHESTWVDFATFLPSKLALEVVCGMSSTVYNIIYIFTDLFGNILDRAFPLRGYQKIFYRGQRSTLRLWNRRALK